VLRQDFIFQKSGVFSNFCKAIAAVDRSVGLGLERYTGFVSAGCANGCVILSRASGGCFTSVAATLAPLGLVLESTLGVELLLADCENKLFPTLFAN
jgi:hypothetical protein